MSRVLFVAIGHTVVRYPEHSFHSSGLIQEVRWEGEKYVRTGIYNPHLTANDPEAYLGGGEAVVTALARAIDANSDSSVLIIGGRPKYLQEAAADQLELSEGSVMATEFKNLTLGYRKAPMVVTHTKTTEDEMQVILSQAAGYDQVRVIALAVRIPRAALLLQKAAMNQPDGAACALRVIFSAAELHLPQGWWPRLERLTGTVAYRNTLASEQAGIRALLSGSYAKGGTS